VRRDGVLKMVVGDEVVQPRGGKGISPRSIDIRLRYNVTVAGDNDTCTHIMVILFSIDDRQ
jgi:hypothetical protein